MNTYTVEIQASNADRTTWQTLAPAETITTDDTAAEVAADVAANQNIAEGNNWRVRVWNEAITGLEPAAEYVADEDPDTDAPTQAGDHFLAELAKTTDIIAKLTGRRDELVRALMRTGTRRDDIAQAAKLTVPRLYQIRDNRR